MLIPGNYIDFIDKDGKMQEGIIEMVRGPWLKLREQPTTFLLHEINIMTPTVEQVSGEGE